MISARPPEIRSTSANCWKTRTGSSELSTVTALDKPDALRARGDGRQGHRRRRDEEVRPVMLADREHVEPELIGQRGLLEQLTHALLWRNARREVGEGGYSELHGVSE